MMLPLDLPNLPPKHTWEFSKAGALGRGLGGLGVSRGAWKVRMEGQIGIKWSRKPQRNGDGSMDHQQYGFI